MTTSGKKPKPEGILAMEEEHADDLAGLLAKMDVG